MKANANVSLKGYDALLNKMTFIERNLFYESLMQDIGAFILTRIKARTLRGIDATGSKFEPYSKSYALFRQKSGRSINKVDLFFYGSMYDAMTFETEDKEVRAYFSNTEDTKSRRSKTGKSVTNAQKAYFNQQKRNFFALSSEDTARITKMVESYYNKLVKTYGSK